MVTGTHFTTGGNMCRGAVSGSNNPQCNNRQHGPTSSNNMYYAKTPSEKHENQLDISCVNYCHYKYQDDGSMVLIVFM
jgi:hypothetical protein